MKKLFISLIILFSSYSLFASHVPGGNISYECIGPNTYVVTLTVLEDCGTAFISNAPESINVSNSCGLTFPTSISLPIVTYQQEISQVCSQQISQTECNGGAFPGVYMHRWSDTLTLSATCDSWIFSFDDCCRNASQNLTGTGSDYYFETVLNSSTSPCNNSPNLVSSPIPYVCINQTVNYNLGIFEPDGDSLIYSLVSALDNPGIPVPYQVGYSGASPINGININPNTGEITFTPTILGNFVVVILVEEFDDNGNLKGSFLHDFQFEVISCSNITPSPPSTGLSNFSGGAVITGNNNIQSCQGDSICFDLVFTDNNSTDSIFINSNVNQFFPGATVSQNSFFSPVTASICLLVGANSNAFNTIVVDAIDNACPISGITSVAIGVSVINSTYAGPDLEICFGDSVQLNGSGGSVFNWSMINGDPINIGNNFSCNNCANPVASPSVTTTYKLSTNLSGGCFNEDTVIVTVGPNFNFSLSQSDSITCINSDVNISVDSLNTNNYLFSWYPSNNLNSHIISNPIFNSFLPGTYNLNLTVDNQLGCQKQDSLSIFVAALEQPNISISSSPLIITPGDTAQLFANHGGSSVTSCGPSLNSFCSSLIADTNVGNSIDSNNQFAYPAPFGHYYKNAKHQFLFRATELHNYGISAGKITEIAWETVAQNAATDTFYSYTVNMGCITSSSLSNWENNLTNVFSPQDVVVNLGWNNLVLTTAYEWDGVSNLVIEICFNNLNNGIYTNNWSTPYQITPFNSAIYYRSDITDACSYTFAPTGLENKRPITKFKVCDVSNPYLYSYNWSPNNNMSNDTVFDPFVNPSTTTTFTAIASYANCIDTSTYTLNVLCDTCALNISDTVCDSYTFNNQIYTQSGFYTDSITSQNSINLVNLDLTINPTYNISITDSACNSYDFLGQILTQSGVYSNTLLSVDGCDSTVSIDLNIVNSTTQTFFYSICPNDTIYINNNMYLSSGIYYDIILDSLGCNDTLIYDITNVNNPTASISLSNDTLFGNGNGGLQPYSYMWNTSEISSFIIANNSGLYSLQITDANNCISDTVNYVVNFLSFNKELYNSFNAYPNPTDENITILIENYYGNIKTELFDLIGNKLQSSSETTISLGDYAKGVYILKVAYGDRLGEVKVIKE
ncbi:T9SS type A sorting domain-containing protein [Bacteroidota bacterium]|nr:T9SS type A sorting domain-containing protein [Bacteroidota bacterium]